MGFTHLTRTIGFVGGASRHEMMAIMGLTDAIESAQGSWSKFATAAGSTAGFVGAAIALSVIIERAKELNTEIDKLNKEGGRPERGMLGNLISGLSGYGSDTGGGGFGKFLRGGILKAYDLTAVKGDSWIANYQRSARDELMEELGLDKPERAATAAKFDFGAANKKGVESFLNSIKKQTAEQMLAGWVAQQGGRIVPDKELVQKLGQFQWEADFMKNYDKRVEKEQRDYDLGQDIFSSESEKLARKMGKTSIYGGLAEKGGLEAYHSLSYSKYGREMSDIPQKQLEEMKRMGITLNDIKMFMTQHPIVGLGRS
jgi:hypothetical protein